MEAAKAKAIKATSAVLVTGLAAGALMAMAVPTDMKHQTDNWRDLIGIRDVTAAEPAIPVYAQVYAPPEDLTPVHWEPASAEYPSTLPQDHWADASADPIPDIGDSPELASEALPPEILAGRTSSNDQDNQAGPADADDAAATAAGAAQATAADVRTVENAAMEPAQAQAPASQPQPAAPQAAS